MKSPKFKTRMDDLRFPNEAVIISPTKARLSPLPLARTVARDRSTQDSGRSCIMGTIGNKAMVKTRFVRLIATVLAYSLLPLVYLIGLVIL